MRECGGNAGEIDGGLGDVVQIVRKNVHGYVSYDLSDFGFGVAGLADGLSILGAYTWAKSLSNADVSSGGGSFLGGIQDYFNLSASRAESVFDICTWLRI